MARTTQQQRSSKSTSTVSAAQQFRARKAERDTIAASVDAAIEWRAGVSFERRLDLALELTTQAQVTLSTTQYRKVEAFVAAQTPTARPRLALANGQFAVANRRGTMAYVYRTEGRKRVLVAQVADLDAAARQYGTRAARLD